MEIREKILSNCGEDPFFWCLIGLSLEQTIFHSRARSHWRSKSLEGATDHQRLRTTGVLVYY